jgi:hypothetical protein
MSQSTDLHLSLELTLHVQDGEKLKTRADRFGTGKQPDAAPNASKKRKSPAPVDPEEEERRRKRAERFGMPVDVSVSYSIFPNVNSLCCPYDRMRRHESA